MTSSVSFSGSVPDATPEHDSTGERGSPVGTEVSLRRMLTSAAFWRTHELHSLVRIVLLLVVALLVCAQIGVVIAGGGIERGDLLALALYASLAAFAWHPLGAALIAMTLCGTSALLTGSGGDLLELAVILVLVSATCARWVIAVHVVLLVALGVWLSVSESTLVANGLYGIFACGVAALLIGVVVRLLTAREAILLAQRARISRAMEDLSRVQQERIADELHDGIAHDLTLVLFHARALPKQPDEAARRISLRTIEDSASRALRSAQSLLAVMRDAAAHPLGDRDDPSPADLAAAAASLGRKLTDAGISTVVSVPPEPPVPPGVAAVLIETLTEAAMNIIKHAPQARSAVIELSVEDGWAALRVRNVGPRTRPAPEAELGGRGLPRSRERLARVGGILEIDDRDGAWTLRALVPVP